MKLKVLELSTGENKFEEWTFLPANWDHELEGSPTFDKNFVFLQFGTLGNFEFTDTGDILILNLVNRTKFWMRSGTVKTQVKDKAAGRIDLENFRERNDIAYQMNVENDGIVIKFTICGYRSTGWFELGWFSNSYIYISKYVN